MKACASMSGDPIDGSAGKTTLDMLPPRQQTRSGRTDGRRRADGDHLSRRNLGRRAGAGRGERCQLDRDRRAAVLCPETMRMLWKKENPRRLCDCFPKGLAMLALASEKQQTCAAGMARVQQGRMQLGSICRVQIHFPPTLSSKHLRSPWLDTVQRP